MIYIISEVFHNTCFHSHEDALIAGISYILEILEYKIECNGFSPEQCLNIKVFLELITDKKYEEALNAINQVTGIYLSIDKMSSQTESNKIENNLKLMKLLN